MNELPERKRCKKCRVWKPASGFNVIRRPLASGGEGQYLRSNCRTCRHEYARGERLDKTPLLDLHASLTVAQRKRIPPSTQRAVRRLRNGEVARVTLQTVEAVCDALEDPSLVHSLYPDLE